MRMRAFSTTLRENVQWIGNWQVKLEPEYDLVAADCTACSNVGRTVAMVAFGGWHA